VKTRDSNSGFTVIELVAVLVLIGILAVTTYSRWFSGDSFESVTTLADISSVARLAQQIAISKPANIVTLEIDRVSDRWQIAVMEDDAGVSAILFQIENVSDNSISVSGMTGPVLLSATNNMVISYDALGNLTDLVVGGTSLGASVGVAILVSIAAPKAMCISPVGFAHSGACV